jgi:hypothetical protein
MASQLGSAITPAGHQAYGDLVNTEMQNTAMAQQAFQNQQGMALAQQQLQMQNDQFNAGLQESERARQFSAAQMKAYQQWQDAGVAKEQRFQLQLEMIQARAQAARDEGNFELVSKLQDEDMQIRRMRAENGMRLSLAANAVGKSQKELVALMQAAQSQIQRQASIEEQNVNLAASHTDGLVSMFKERDRQGAIGSVRNIKAPNEALGSFMGSAQPIQALFGPDIGDVESLAAAGELTGIEWLTYGPSTGLSGFSPSTTRQGSLVSGQKSPAEIADAIKGRVVDSVL